MIHISDAEFDRAVEEALAEVPDEFQPYLENVVVEVRDRPDRAFRQRHRVPRGLLGLYIGVPLDRKGPDMAPVPLPDRIVLFRDNLCRACYDREELIDEIRVTVLHEVGHHVGLDEDRLEELGYG